MRGRPTARFGLTALLCGTALTPSAHCQQPAGATEAGLFADRAAEAGLDFVHVNGMSGGFYYNEMMGGGVALLDYDGDGDLDVYLVQGGDPGGTGRVAEADRSAPVDRLFRNDLELRADGARLLRFIDVTERMGIRSDGYGMGVATGDVDNDGRVDLYVTNYGANRLLRNLGDGRFADITEASGSAEMRWSVAATFLDFDRDGWLDLFVANYVRFDPADNLACTDASGRRDYCGPLAYRPEPDRLLRNRGDGSFEDVTARAGIQREFGAALGVVAGDFDGDGWSDLYVANDMTANQLWINQRDGTFRNEALLAGCAVNGDGQPEASMGIAAGDFDGDGDEDLFLTHLVNQTNTLYQNGGGAQFRDRTRESGLGAPSWTSTGFGTAWIDYDSDGRLDLMVVNGAVTTIEALVRAGDPYPLHQTNQLFRGLGAERFEEVTDRAGPAFRLSEVSRGLAVGDLDNDGDPDAVVGNNAAPARLLVNRVGQDGSWLGLRLTGQPPLAELEGTTATLSRPEAAPITRTVRTGGGYASAADPRILTGLGTAAGPDVLEVRWPDGRTARWTDPPTRVYLTIRRAARPAP